MRASLLACLMGAALLASPSCSRFQKREGTTVQPFHMPERIEPKPGRWSLMDLGIYTVSYSFADGRKGQMPQSWSGHFDGPTGISCLPYGERMGRRALLIHCPWRTGTGATTVRYPLTLPEVRPISLRLAIAMRDDIAREGKSDGSDFRVYVLEGDKPTVLLDKHYAKGEWENHSFDLSDYAGREIDLVLETGPGPQNDPGFDYSLFGDPVIVVGADSTPAERTTWKRPQSLADLSNRSGAGCGPSCAWQGENSFRWHEDEGIAVFAYCGPDCTIRYQVRPSENWLDGIEVIVTDDTGNARGMYKAFSGAGPTLAASDETDFAARLGSVVQTEDGVEFTHDYSTGSLRASLKTLVRISGKTLVFELTSHEPAFSKFDFGSVIGPLRRDIEVPYLGLGPVQWLPDSGLFSSVILDWKDSNATNHSATTANYDAMTDGSRNPLREVAYLTFAPLLAEVFPNIPHAASPYVDDLAGRIMFDIWGGHYARDAERLRELASYGIRDAAIIKHVWQRSGYDNALPNHVPANANLGGDDAMRQLVSTAVELGYRISLHENYVDFYPNSDYWCEKDVALRANGKWIGAWFNGAVGVQSYFLKPTSAMKYARQESPEVHKRYGTNAAYLDVHTCVPPWFRTDADAKAPGAGMFRTLLTSYAELFLFERLTHEGPLFGEGHNHFFWAGLCDGSEAQVRGGDRTPLLLEFDLLKLHPQMVNHGMGYFERWLPTGYTGNWTRRIPTPEELDKYRASQIAYGHAGFVAQQTWPHTPIVIREFCLVTPVQRRYVPARVVRILYDVNGELLPAEEAVPAGSTDRALIEYDNGLSILVNRSVEDWSIQGELLPSYGWLARAPGLISTTGYFPQEGGGSRIADYCEADGLVYADARSWMVLPEQASARVKVRPPTVSPLGGRRFKITYHWRALTRLEPGMVAYVHFVNSKSDRLEGIVFQHDHSLDPPTQTWKKNEDLADGPHVVEVEAEVPDGAYDIRAGIYSKQTGHRAENEGVRVDERGRAILGTVTVEGDRILYEAPPPAEPAPDLSSLYSRRMNPEKRVVDFGPVRTNGCVIVKKGRNEVFVTIAPRGEDFVIHLDLGSLAPRLASGEIRLIALDLDRRALKAAMLTTEAGWVQWSCGQPGAAHYRLTAP